MDQSLNIALSAVAAMLLFFGFLAISKTYVKKKFHSCLYMAIAWFSFMAEALFSAMIYGFQGDAFMYSVLLKLDNLSLIPGFIGLIAFLESLTRDSIEPKSFSVLLFVLGIDVVLVIIMPVVALGSFPWIIVVSIGALVSFASFVFCVRLYRSVPLNLKRAALMTIIGEIFTSLIFIIMNIVDALTSDALGSFDRVCEGIGALILAIVFARNEQLFYVLPFKTQRLIVYGTKNGTSLFAHTWSSAGQALELDEDLLSGMLHGMSMLFNESLRKGNLQEIKTENGILIVKQYAAYPVAFVLIASRSSSVLRDGLTRFSDKFIEMFGDSLDQIADVSIFQEASRLMQSSLSFIPQYD